MKTAVGMLIAVAVLTAAPAAHPGHGEVAMLSGKVTAVETDRIQIDVFDRASFSRKRVWVFVDAKTKIQNGKVRVASTELKRDLEIDCIAETEEGKDGATALRAVQIRFKRSK